MLVPGFNFATKASIGARPEVVQAVVVDWVGTSRQAPPGLIAFLIGKSVIGLLPVKRKFVPPVK